MSRRTRPIRLIKERSLENPGLSLSQALEGDEILGPAAGIEPRVSQRTALTLSAIFRGISLVANTLAKMPLHLYERIDEQARRRALDHPAYHLVRRKPNEWMTAFAFKQLLQGHALLRGNGYAYIVRNGAAEPIELLPLLPTETYPVRENGRLWYVTLVGSELRKLPPQDVIHIRGLGYDGLMGYDVLSLARESLGLGLGAQKYASAFFRNGSRSSGLLMYPMKMRPEAVETLRRDWDRLQTGLANAHRVIVLQDGVKYQQLTIPPEEAQMIETRQHELREAGNWLGVPSHKLGDKEGQAYNSLEQENQSFLDDSIDPWAVAWEEELGDKLLSEREKQTDSHFFSFERKALVRADLTARANFYERALRNRWMLPDEVRAREEMNPLPGGAGQQLLPLGNQPEQASRLLSCLADAVRRMARRIVLAAQRAQARGKLQEFAARAAEQHGQVVIAAFRPALGRAARRASRIFLQRLLAEIAAAPALDALETRYQRGTAPRRLAQQFLRRPS
jgi:HK97 family phage portal protein